MTIRPLLRYPDRRLATPAHPVTAFDGALRELAADLLDTMRAAPGIGITAPHIGVPLRVVVLELDAKAGPQTYVNPEIEWASPEMILHKEGSVSMPGVNDEVQRHARVRISYWDLDGNMHSEEFGWLTRRLSPARDRPARRHVLDPAAVAAEAGTAGEEVREDVAGLSASHNQCRLADRPGCVDACCSSEMFMDFGRGRHWVSAYRARFQRELPPLQLQVCTKFKPIGVVLPEGVYSLRRDVRFRMRSRTHVLDPSLTGRDPTRTFRVAARLLPPCNSKCRLGATGPSGDYRSHVRNKVLRSALSQRRGLSGRSEGAVTEQRVQRRLAAILAADVVGYSALMQRAEEATYAEFERLKRELIEPSLSRHDGRLIKTTGDGALAEFASPLAAVRCAVEMQDHLAEGSGPFKLRIGLNLGDVIVGQDGDLYGDGINIAVRLEGIADPGGILISEKVYSEVEGKLDVGFEDRGEQQLKNISKPVRAYAVRAGAS